MVTEQADVVVVGTRCAGTAAAIALAGAGRSVIGLDSSAFPSDTLSTHLLWPSGVFELAELGALPRVLALGAPPLTTGLADGAGFTVRAPFGRYGTIGYSMCVRRAGLDAALVDTARAAGAQIRERSRVVALVWAGRRVVGVRYLDRNGNERRIDARLVIGADGRRSTVARLVGAHAPYRIEPSGRSCVFAYWHDTSLEWRSVAAQWRSGDLLGTAFPCDGGLLLCLIQPPRDRAVRVAGQIERQYRRMIAELPGLSDRLDGCTLRTRVRSAVDLESYFRRSGGPGWALPGDSGHFKDPVTAQGIRDALRYGRLLGESVARVLDDPQALDRQVSDWEMRREAECLEMYQYTNRLARGEEMTPIEVELYRAGVADPALGAAMMEVVSRIREPRHLMRSGRKLAIAAGALARAGDRGAAWRAIVRDAHDEISERAQRSMARPNAARHARGWVGQG
ncbi:NAD(P)/FAD-dependent oxidoreductase [Nocardia sp. NPDC056000]|uniref:NAD(P)/FAD-dependent oxidoreductase n=1 Tax=Nocardia sp. NPDC056000 TaxID=3345674 RepID=UPI0035E3BB1B